MEAQVLCPKPFESMSLGWLHYSTCCSDWLAPGGRVAGKEVLPPWEAWNHAHVQTLRHAMLDDDPRFCRRCPWYITGRTQEMLGVTPTAANDFVIVKSTGPRTTSIDVDRTCNFACRSCRARYVQVDRVQERLAAARAWLDAFLPDLRLLSLSSVADPLASSVCRAVLTGLDGARYPYLDIRLCTNAQLLARLWPSLENIHRNVRYVHVSIDAATEATYQRLRGGLWSNLLAGLELIRDLRASGQVRQFVANFCVQDVNFREMPAFVRLVREYGATKVVFTHLRRFPHISPADYRTWSLVDPGHPLARDFAAVLLDPDLRDPIVDLTHLCPSVQAAVAEQYR